MRRRRNRASPAACSTTGCWSAASSGRSRPRRCWTSSRIRSATPSREARRVASGGAGPDHPRPGRVGAGALAKPLAGRLPMFGESSRRIGTSPIAPAGSRSSTPPSRNRNSRRSWWHTASPARWSPAGPRRTSGRCMVRCWSHRRMSIWMPHAAGGACLPSHADDAAALPYLRGCRRDDPYVAFRRAIDMAKAGGAELVDIGDAGHINPSAGYGEWPAGERLLRGLRPESPHTTSRDCPRGLPCRAWSGSRAA